MELLRKLEDGERIIMDAQKIRNFQKEINNTYDKNLDECLIEFIDKNNLEDSEVEGFLRKYNKMLKQITI